MNILIMLFLPFIVAIVILFLSARWVSRDCRKFVEAGVNTLKPGTWALLVFFLWFPSFPLYLLNRAMKYKPLSENPNHQPKTILINIIAILLILAALFVYVQRGIQKAQVDRELKNVLEDAILNSYEDQQEIGEQANKEGLGVEVKISEPKDITVEELPLEVTEAQELEESGMENIKELPIQQPEESFLSYSRFTVTPPSGWYLWEGSSAGINAARNFNHSYATNVLGDFILLHSTTTEVKNNLDSWDKGFNEGDELDLELQNWSKVDSQYLVFTNSDVDLKNRELNYILDVAEVLKEDHTKYGLVIIKFTKTVYDDYTVGLVSNVLNNEKKEEFIKEDVRSSKIYQNTQ